MTMSSRNSARRSGPSSPRASQQPRLPAGPSYRWSSSLSVQGPFLAMVRGSSTSPASLPSPLAVGLLEARPPLPMSIERPSPVSEEN